MPIKGLSEQRRLPRLGKIHLGKKVNNSSGNGQHPVATDYFVLPPELLAIYGEGCTELPMMIPLEDDELWCNQYYKRYSMTRGLVCRGDGETCRRMVDVKTGSTADRNSKEIAWKEGLPCTGVNCPDYQSKACKEVMNLQFIMPDVPGLGVWQVDTGSINSIRNINSAAAMIRAVYKRIAFLPILLTLEPIEVVNPDDGKKKTVRVLNFRVRGTIREMMSLASKPYAELLLPEAIEDDSPLDAETVEGEVIPPTTNGHKVDPAKDQALFNNEMPPEKTKGTKGAGQPPAATGTPETQQVKPEGKVSSTLESKLADLKAMTFADKNKMLGFSGKEGFDVLAILKAVGKQSVKDVTLEDWPKIVDELFKNKLGGQ